MNSTNTYGALNMYLKHGAAGRLNGNSVHRRARKPGVSLNLSSATGGHECASVFSPVKWG